MFDKPIVPHFHDDERLFRRYRSSHIQEGELDPSAIRFDEPPSFLRSAFSRPEDALHRDCADGKDVSEFGVLEMKVSAAYYKDGTSDRCSRFSQHMCHCPLAMRTRKSTV